MKNESKKENIYPNQRERERERDVSTYFKLYDSRFCLICPAISKPFQDA